MQAIMSAAVAGRSGLELKYWSAVQNIHGRNAFEELFSADTEPRPFKWGTASKVVARDALLDLLDRSATTFSWELRCSATANVQDNSCVLNIRAVEVNIVGADGKPATKVVTHDRCGKCAAIQVFSSR
jgi:hypothetical protein